MFEPGKTLLHYRIVDKLGEGGMGVVWKALDTTLGREVAIKVLPQALTSDPERVARFEREAKMLASLNHPNIATIHGFHEEGGTLFLAMELVEGQDLSQRLAAGRMPLDETLQLAGQVADGLQAAHDAGVVHRDLKPANVRLTADGTAKVLDLGLAKACSPDAISGEADARLSLSPTMTSAGTAVGMLLGTAGYMSPEQARGQVADRRSDVWAFGCLLYEMLSGHQAFCGSTASDTLASVLKSEPDWNKLPADTPRGVRRLLRRCLNKDADRRLHHIADARLEIRETLEAPAEELAEPAAMAPAVAPSKLRFLPWALTAILAVVAAGALRQLATTEAPASDAPAMALAVPLPSDIRYFEDQFTSMAISRDGLHIAMILIGDDQRSLYVRHIDELEPRPLAGTEGAANPFFSPDGRWIGFFADNRLKKISVDGGNPVTLCESTGITRGATWADADVVIFSRHYTDALLQVPGTGGEATPFTTLDLDRKERTHRFPQAVPGTDVVLFTVQTTDSPEFYDDANIDAVRISTGERKTIYEGASYARYARSGHLLVGREGFLFAIPFDIERLESTGNPTPVLENVLGTRNSGVVHAEVSETGVLAYVVGQSRMRRRHLTWFRRDGTSERLSAPVDSYVGPRISPDGTRIAVAIIGGTQFDIWTYDLAHEARTRLTFEGDNQAPVWSPDGERIAFGSVRGGAAGNAYIKAADGSGAAELLFAADSLEGGGVAFPMSFLPDGSALVMNAADADGSNIRVLKMDGSGESDVFLQTPHSEYQAEISPDGKWLTYVSDESGSAQVYVREFPGPGGRWQISVDGGAEPYWTRGGKELIYRRGGSVFSVEIDTTAAFRYGRPKLLFDTFPVLPAGNRVYHVTPDGERLLVSTEDDNETDADRITVVVNWLDDLARRVPR